MPSSPHGVAGTSGGQIFGLRVLVVGAGTVGRATGVGLISKGNQVAFVDPDFRTQESLRQQGLRILGPQNVDLDEFDVVMLAVPTPTIDGHMEDRDIVKASIQIGSALKTSLGYKVVCVRSTVLPTTTRNIVIPSLETSSGRKAGPDFGVCVNPEFLREADALEDFLHPDRILIGEIDERSGRVLEKLYESFQRPILHCRLEEAELAKYTANSFLATKISYFNEISGICEKFGADPRIVTLAVAMDKRIGSYGTVGGTPYGGKCLPKDVDALLAKVGEMGERLEVLASAARINKRMEILFQVKTTPEPTKSSIVQDAK